MGTRRTANLARGLVFLAITATITGCSATTTNDGQAIYRTPEEAVQAFGSVVGSGDSKRSDVVFGPGSADLFQSGDDVADRQHAAEAKSMVEERVIFEDRDDHTKIPVLGNEEWPFPIPLVKVRGGWRYDSVTGHEEVLKRRNGRNEVSTIATLHAVVDAQREYFAGYHDGRTKTYAAKVSSNPGKHDGLYWPSADGKDVSPLGPLVAKAATEGYTSDNAEPAPYHGYYYHMLAEQGAHATGGAKSYKDAKGAMTKGFAMVAWPARHGVSGVMTFVVGNQGIVFQKDLGATTGEVAATITAFDPDDSWSPAPD